MKSNRGVQDGADARSGRGEASIELSAVRVAHDDGGRISDHPVQSAVLDQAAIDGQVNNCDVSGGGQGTDSWKDEDVALYDRSALKRELSAIFNMAWPISATGALQMMFVLMAISFVGVTGERPLAVTGLGTMFFNVSGLSIVIGLASALDTFCSQFYGAAQYRLVGVALQRSLVVCAVACIPIYMLWFFTADLLEMFGIEHSLALEVSGFVRILSVGLIPAFVFDCLRKYLTCQGLVNPALYSILAAISIHYILLTLVANYGIASSAVVGGAVALAVGNISCALFLFLWIFKTGIWKKTWILGPGTWHGWTWECCEHIQDYLRIALPSAGSICLEWWCFEIITLFSGSLGTSVIAAQTILFNTVACTYLFGLGIGITASARVGNALGAHKPVCAERSMAATLLAVGVTMTCVTIALWTMREPWVSLYTSDASVVQQALNCMPIQCAFLVFDGGNAVLQGILRGCGKQRVAFLSALVSYYAIGLPLGLHLTFTRELGLRGLWYGLAMGSISCFSCQGIYLSRVTWKLVAEEAADRVDAHRATEEKRSADACEGAAMNERSADAAPSSLPVTVPVQTSLGEGAPQPGPQHGGAAEEKELCEKVESSLIKNAV